MYNIANGTPTNSINPAGLSYDKEKSLKENFDKNINKYFDVNDESTSSYTNSSVSGYYLDKATELVGYTFGLMLFGQALSGATGTASTSGIVRDASGNIIGGSGLTASGGGIGITLGGHTLNLSTLAFTGGMASGLQEANSKENVTDTERWAKGFSSGLIETITEGFMGTLGIGGNDITDKFVEKAANQFSSTVGKVLVSAGIRSSGEALEELASYGLNYLVDNNVINKLGEADFSQEWNKQEVYEQMALAFVSSMISQGGGDIIGTNSAIKSAEEQLGRKLTDNEKAFVTQAVISGTMEENLVKYQEKIDTIEKTNPELIQINQEINLLNEQLKTTTDVNVQNEILAKISSLEEQAKQIRTDLRTKSFEKAITNEYSEEDAKFYDDIKQKLINEAVNEYKQAEAEKWEMV